MTINKHALRMRNYLDMALKSRVKLLHLSTDELEGLLDELDAAEKRIAEFDQRIRTQNRHACELFDEAKAQRQRVAELEASHSKLRESMAAIHNTIRLDGAQTSLAVILNAAKRAHEESAAAAGIKGE